MFKIQTFTVNFIQENCYVISDETGEGVIIDCGAFYPEEREAIDKYLQLEGIKLRHMLNTHGHFDHIFGNQHIHQNYGLKTKLHELDVQTYDSSKAQMLQFMHRELPLEVAPLGETFVEGDVIHFGSHNLSVIHTPGHTPGSCCFYCESESVLFSGDSLFRHSIGRCDLPGGDPDALPHALVTKILTLPPTTKILPGHGDPTYVGEEKEKNPYLLGIS